MNESPEVYSKALEIGYEKRDKYIYIDECIGC